MKLKKNHNFKEKKNILQNLEHNVYNFGTRVEICTDKEYTIGNKGGDLLWKELNDFIMKTYCVLKGEII